MKRLLVILISIFLTINIVGAGVVQYHHHHHGDESICLCMPFGHVDECHTGDGDCCANDCDTSNSNDYHHLHRLDDFNVEKIAPAHTQVIDFQLLAVLVNHLIYSLTAEPVTTCYIVDRTAVVYDVCDRDAATRRGPPQC